MVAVFLMEKDQQSLQDRGLVRRGTRPHLPSLRYRLLYGTTSDDAAKLRQLMEAPTGQKTSCYKFDLDFVLVFAEWIS